MLADSRNGRLDSSTGASCKEEEKLLREYNQVLFSKLEKKMTDLERVNKDLEQLTPSELAVTLRAALDI